MIRSHLPWMVGLLLLVTASRVGAVPFLEQVDVWTSGEDGYHTYRIPALTVTARGTSLAFCEARKSGSGDHGDVDLVVKRSVDGGRTWSKQQIVHEEGGDAKITIGNPCPVVDAESGTIWLPFCRDNKKVFITSSADDGRTWSTPRDFSDVAVRPEWTWVATGPGVGIQLRRGRYAGRLVIPCDHKLRGPDGKEEMNSHMLFSDDRGRTWRIGAAIQPGGNECQVAELADGTLLVNTRMQGGFQGLRGTAVSTDGGSSWSTIRHEPQLPCPKCQGSLLNAVDSNGRRLLLFSNPHPPESKSDKPSGERVRLTVRLSRDDGKTWTHVRRLHDGMSAYSCLGQLPDGALLCLYEWGEKRSYQGIRIARFDLDWLTAEPEPNDTRQAAKDAEQDRTTIIYDGVTPNKMVCDTTLRRLPDGSWVLFFLAGGDTEPSPLNYTAVCRSRDEGRTWSKAEPFDTTFPRTGKTIGQGPTELMVLGDELTLFFSTHSQHWRNDWRSWIMRSGDNGATWSKPEAAPGRLRDRTFLRGHIVTRDGRVMVPFQHYVGPDDEQGLPVHDRKLANPRNGVLISRDGGKTWSEHGNVRLTENDRYFGWAEITLAELSDGRIVMLLRADKLGGVLYAAESQDGGVTWPDLAHQTDIPNPGSKATVYALGNDAFALLHNPNPAHRSPMALWISFDGLKTWPYRRVLQAESVDGPQGRMNYPDGFVSADKQYLHFAFDDNRHRAVYYGAKLPPLPKK